MSILARSIFILYDFYFYLWPPLVILCGFLLSRTRQIVFNNGDVMFFCGMVIPLYRHTFKFHKIAPVILFHLKEHTNLISFFLFYMFSLAPCLSTKWISRNNEKEMKKKNTSIVIYFIPRWIFLSCGFVYWGYRQFSQRAGRKYFALKIFSDEG